eukprot:scaffold109101_cov53-Phaeocystis_antarctica.AAC.1
MSDVGGRWAVKGARAPEAVAGSPVDWPRPGGRTARSRRACPEVPALPRAHFDHAAGRSDAWLGLRRPGGPMPLVSSSDDQAKGVPGERRAALEGVEPDGAADEEVPYEHVRPLLGHEVAHLVRVRGRGRVGVHTVALVFIRSHRAGRTKHLEEADHAV